MTVDELGLDRLVAAAMAVGVTAAADQVANAARGSAWCRWWAWCEDLGLDATESAGSVEVIAEWLDRAGDRHSSEDVAATLVAIRNSATR